MNPSLELCGKTVAITGASGYLGSAIADSLVASSISTLAISRKELIPRPGMMSIRADVNSYECWTSIVEQAQVIFHLAGNTSVYKALKAPAESLNSTLLPLDHLIKAAQELGRRPRVVFSSTATVYGLTEKFPVAETADPCPITAYDLHKLFAEQQLAMATRLGILDGVSLRLANVYGPSSSLSSAVDRGILNKVAALATRQNKPVIYGDGKYLRDYVYIADVVNAFLHAGVLPGIGGSVFNVASGIGITLRKAFETVIDQATQATGHHVALASEPWPANTNPIEFRNFVASIDSFKSATGWKPAVGLREGIGLLIADMTARWNDKADTHRR